MRIEVLAPHDLSPQDLAVWSRLQTDGPLQSPFLSPKWVQTLARSGGPDRKQVRVAKLVEDGETVGFLPARVSRFTARPPGAPLCDYQGLIAPQRLRVDPREIVAAFGVARFDFDKLLADQTSFRPHFRGASSSQVIDLRGGYDAYEADRRAAGTDILKDCAKKHRKLEREHGEVMFTAASASQADFDQLIAWKRAQYAATGQTDIFEAGWTAALLRSLFQRDPSGDDAAFGGAFFTLHVAGKLAAAHFALRQGAVLHAWFIAHDEAFARYSPGVILINEILKWAPAQGVGEVDLGPGDYRFKHSLANVKRDVAHGYIGRLSAATLARSAAYRVRATAEALPLGRFSALPGKAMRRLDLIRSL